MATLLAETVDLTQQRRTDGAQTMKFTFAPESKPLEGFTIKRAIQRGGFGEVYYALSDAGKEVALKLVQQNMDIELRGVSQCLNLKHPNLVTIFDIRTDADGDHWVVMEYVSGRSMDLELADAPNGMPIEQIQKWLSGIVAGVSYLHDRGIVHRDLKPANIFYEHGYVKTGDVGLSKSMSPSRRSAHTQSVGTVYYMAPEIARGRYGREVDVYSLAIILYEALTGRVPFEGETTAEILMKHLSDKPDLSPLPRSLRPVLARALEKDPNKRTSSVAELEREFNQAVGGPDTPIEIPDSAFENDESSDDRLWVTLDSTDESPNHKASTVVLTESDVKPIQVTVLPAEPVWYKQSEFWWRIGIIVVALALIAPGMLGLGVTLGFLVVAYIAVAYGLYQLVGLFTSAATNAVTGRHGSSRERNGRYRPMHDRDDRRGQGATNVRPVAPRGNRGRRVNRPYNRAYHANEFTPLTRRSLSLRQRSTELTGSMSVAALCTAVITAGLCLLTSFLNTPGQIGLFASTTLLAAWAVLLPAKLWEGGGTDVLARRLTLLVLGALIGTAAYRVDQVLMVGVSQEYVSAVPAMFHRVGPYALESAAEPTLAGYIVFFASLLFLRRWWWHADAFRPKRLSLKSLLVTLFLGYLISMFWQFPVAWAMLWAVAISSVVQISSVWIPHEDRERYLGRGVRDD